MTLLLLACLTPTTETTESTEVSWVVRPHVPTDPMSIDVDRLTVSVTDERRRADGPCDSGEDRCEVDRVEESWENPEPILVGPSDQRAALEARINANTGEGFAWQPTEPLESGDWRLTGIEGSDVELNEIVRIQQTLEPEPRTWKLESSRLPSGTDLANFVEVWFILEELDGSEATFRIVGEYDEERCTFFRGVGELQEGHLSWSGDPIEADLEPPITAHDPWLELSFAEDGHAYGEVHALLDLRAFDAAQEDVQLCELISGFGVSCEAPCPDDEAACLDAMVHALDMKPVPPLDFSELPSCGADLSDVEVPTWSCDLDLELDGLLCASTPLVALGWPALMALTSIVRRR